MLVRLLGVTCHNRRLYGGEKGKSKTLQEGGGIRVLDVLQSLTTHHGSRSIVYRYV